MALSKLLLTVACVLMLGAVVPTQVVADQAQFIYDDIGRLSQVNGNKVSPLIDARQSFG